MSSSLLLRPLFVYALIVAPVHAEEAVRVYAAASLTNAMTDIGIAWKDEGHAAPILVFAASSTLAKQIDAGAPFGIFASADQQWMDDVEKNKKIDSASRTNLLGNTLVLIVPKGRRFEVRMDKSFDLPAAFAGKLCTGEPDAVPVGIYAKEALQSLGWWDRLKSRVVGTDDVRTALAFVERAECPVGIVYATDAAISSKVEVLATFPETTYKPIVYPFAVASGVAPDTKTLFEYLKAPVAARVFEHYGFTLLAR